MLRDKRLVAASFSKAANRYDQVANLQRRIADHLSQWLGHESAEVALDLGSGTGYANAWLAGCSTRLINLDLAEGMLRYARSLNNEGSFTVGDAECLPLADQSCDLIWSSLALQWSEQPTLLFNELARVTSPGARVLIATLGPETLCELREAWAKVDQHQHVNRFIDVDQWLTHANAFERVRHEQVREVERFDTVSQLIRSLRDLGAHNVNPDRAPGLGGQRSLRKMIELYAIDSTHKQQVPATYDVHYIELKRR